MLEHQWDEFALGCDIQKVLADHVEDRGRILRAAYDIGPDEKILSAPVEYKVHMPNSADEDGDLRRTAEESNSAASISERFAVVCEICHAHGVANNYDAYWAALMSLTADEGPADTSWPCISAKTQVRLLLLFRPKYISSFCRGRRLVDRFLEHSHTDTGSRTYESSTKSTLDVVVEQLCKSLRLRVCPSKFENLVLVWKYNSFSGSLDPDVPDDGSVVISLAPALCSHSCIPSAYWEYGEDGSFNIYAGTRGLKEGEEVTICYLSKKLICDLNTLQRRDVLACSWLFFCQCEQCACIVLPQCQACPGSCMMEVFVCWCEEALYPGSVACCSSCHHENLQGTSGYFFHCPVCNTDLCAGCGAWVCGLESCSSLSSFFLSGMWMHEGQPEKGVELIIGDTLRWHAGGTSKVTVCSKTHLYVEVDGCQYEADLVDEKLIWSDGETWVRQSSCAESI